MIFRRGGYFPRRGMKLPRRGESLSRREIQYASLASSRNFPYRLKKLLTYLDTKGATRARHYIIYARKEWNEEIYIIISISSPKSTKRNNKSPYEEMIYLTYRNDSMVNIC